jgi:hypothetical protein
MVPTSLLRIYLSISIFSGLFVDTVSWLYPRQMLLSVPVLRVFKNWDPYFHDHLT